MMGGVVMVVVVEEEEEEEIHLTHSESGHKTPTPHQYLSRDKRSPAHENVGVESGQNAPATGHHHSELLYPVKSNLVSFRDFRVTKAYQV